MHTPSELVFYYAFSPGVWICRKLMPLPFSHYTFLLLSRALKRNHDFAILCPPSLLCPQPFFPTASPCPLPQLLSPSLHTHRLLKSVFVCSLLPLLCSCPAAGVGPTALPHPWVLPLVLTFVSKKR